MAKLSITDAQAETLEQMVRSGLYADTSSIIDEAIEASIDREMERHARLQMLREAIALGEADIAAGRVTVLRSPEDITALFDALEEEAARQETVAPPPSRRK